MKPEKLKTEIAKCCFINKGLIYIDNKKAIELIEQFETKICARQREKCANKYIKKVENDSTFGDIYNLIKETSSPNKY